MFQNQQFLTSTPFLSQEGGLQDKSQVVSSQLYKHKKLQLKCGDGIFFLLP